MLLSQKNPNILSREDVVPVYECSNQHSNLRGHMAFIVPALLHNRIHFLCWVSLSSHTNTLRPLRCAQPFLTFATANGGAGVADIAMATEALHSRCINTPGKKVCLFLFTRHAGLKNILLLPFLWRRILSTIVVHSSGLIGLNISPLHVLTCLSSRNV